MAAENIPLFMPGLESEHSKLAAQRAMHSQYVLQLLQLQRRAGFLCDITVHIGDRSFKAHKPLLAACSLYFRSLFNEGENTNSSTLNLTKLSPDGFEVLLDYIYSGSLAITTENSDQVLYAANCLQMTNVVETCLNFIRSSFQSSLSRASLKQQTNEGQPLLVNPEVNPSFIQTPGMFHQDNLQILSTSTIKEAEFNKIGNVEKGIAAIPSQIPQISHFSTAAINPHRSIPAAIHPGAKDVHLPLPNSHLSLNTNLPHVVNAAPPFQMQVTPNVTQRQPPGPNEPNPSSETLNKLMPYLVARNARRPTLNEVKQLLMNGSYPNAGAEYEEQTKRFTLKQPPPALITMEEAYQKMLTTPSANPATNTVRTTNARVDVLQVPVSQVVHPTNKVQLTSIPLLSSAASTKIPSSSSTSAANSTTNQTTAHTETFTMVHPPVNSKEMQPFVVINPLNNVALTSASKPLYPYHSTDDNQNRSSWSEDRSVVSGHSDQITDLSGTPCKASFVVNSSSALASFTSTSPSLQISPISSTSVDSRRGSTFPIPPKEKCSRTLSVDNVTWPEREDASDHRQTRSTGSTPLDLSSNLLSSCIFNGDDSMNSEVELPQSFAKKLNSTREASRISIEQATNAVGALFVQNSSEKTNKDSSEEKVDDPEVHHMENITSVKPVDGVDKLYVSSPHGEMAKTKECHPIIFVSESNSLNDFSMLQEESKRGDTAEKQDDVVDAPLDVKQEPGEDYFDISPDLSRSSRTSPPPEDPFQSIERDTDAAESIASTAGSNVNMSDNCDDNMVLDLTMPKTSRDKQNTVVKVMCTNDIIPSHDGGEMVANNALQHKLVSGEFLYRKPPGKGAEADSKMREASDALVMLQMSNDSVSSSRMVLNSQPSSAHVSPSVCTTANITALYPGSFQSVEESSSLSVGYSRKPRRSSGGQTCQWPGCGRLFRHRNIYEEHQKLHEMGVPVSQLRKCYMGARVKKTVRERLEEMRNVETGSGGATEDHGHENGEYLAYPSSSSRFVYNKKRKNAVVQQHQEGPERKRVTIKDRKEHYRTQQWKQPSSSSLSSLVTPTQQALLHQTAALATRQAVSSSGPFATTHHQTWQAGPAFVGGTIASTSAITNTVERMQSALSLIPTASHHQANIQTRAQLPVANYAQMAIQQPPSLNTSVVAETLAALGIQLPPSKRAAEEVPSSRLVVPTLPQEISVPTMSLDQLRRRIALRGNEPLGAINPSDLQGIVAHPSIAEHLPLKQAITTWMLSSSGPGNVMGINSMANTMSSLPATASVQLPVPNHYPGQSSSGQGSMCS